MHASSVLLPAPLGPTSATISALPTLSVTPDSAARSPYDACRSRTSSTVGGPQIDVDHEGIGGDRRRRSLGDLLAGAQDQDPLRQVEESPDDVLDHDERE